MLIIQRISHILSCDIIDTHYIKVMFVAEVILKCITIIQITKLI